MTERYVIPWYVIPRYVILSKAKNLIARRSAKNLIA